MPSDPATEYGVKFYGRRKGKALRAGKAAAFEEVLPSISLVMPAQAGIHANAQAARWAPAFAGATALDPATLFPFPVRDIQLEIGFGDGEHLLHQALNNPETGFIGCEPFVNGVAALCVGIKQHGIKNIRVWPDDARLFMPHIKDESLSRCFILNSDPWPKTRHHKRRFIQKETLDELHRMLQKGAELRLSSDHPALTAWQLEKTLHHGGFEWTAKCAADWRDRPADMPETRYQKKNMAGHPMTFLSFRRT